MSMADGALSAKAKAMYGRRLLEKDYLELLKKHSVAEITSYLKNETDYAGCLKDIHENSVHRGQLEKVLSRNLFDKMLQLYRYAGKKQEIFYKINMKQVEIDLILERIRAIQANDFSESIADMPLYLDKFTAVHLDEFIKVRTYDDMLHVLRNTRYYEVMSKYTIDDLKEHYTSLETDLQKLYYEHVFQIIDRQFHGTTRKDLRIIYATNVELSNITKIYRYKKFYSENYKDLRNALIHYQSRLSDRILEDMIAAPNVKAMLSILAESPYRLFVDDNEYVYIEYYADKVKYNVAKKFMYFSTSAPLVFSAYQQLLQLEVNNLITIIEGVRYKIPTDDIEHMLIY